MSKISAGEVKKLRDKTGAGMLEARNALAEAGGDTEQAVEILRKKGAVKALKKAERATRSGLVEAYIHGEGRIGVLLEVDCETDFVARNEEFRKLAHDLALHIAAEDPQDAGALLSQPFVRDQSITVQELLNNKIAVLGENIQVRRFARYMVGE